MELSVALKLTGKDLVKVRFLPQLSEIIVSRRTNVRVLSVQLEAVFLSWTEFLHYIINF